MTAPDDGTLRSSFDRANPNTLADLCRKIGFGSLLQGQIAQTRKKVNFDALGNTTEHVATLDAIRLPISGKAAAVLRATVRAGTVTGELTPDLYGVTPATTEIAVAPNGDIVVLAADAITDCDITYIPERCDIVDTVFPVVAGTGVLTLPAALVTRGVILLDSVDVLEGTATGAKQVLVPTSSAPAAGSVRLSIAKDVIHFAVADAVTRARVRLGVVPNEDHTALLEASATIY